MMALERYNSEISQRDMVRWRMASEKLSTMVFDEDGNAVGGGMGAAMRMDASPGRGRVLHKIQY